LSIAESFINELEKDARLRKRLAELLVSEPDVRLALINAVIADVATKNDINELRKEMKDEIKQLRSEINQIRGEVNQVRGELSQEVDQVRNELGQEINQLRNEINQVRGELSQIRNELSQIRSELRSNLRWIIGTVVVIWSSTLVPILLKIAGII